MNGNVSHQRLVSAALTPGIAIPVPAILTARLVLIDSPPSVYWCGKEIPADWEKQKVVWEYLFKLAQAAKLRRPISSRDFGSDVNARTLTNWKHRLLKIDDLFENIGDLIQSRHGEHRLDLPPDEIRVFQHAPGEGLRELRY